MIGSLEVRRWGVRAAWLMAAAAPIPLAAQSLEPSPPVGRIVDVRALGDPAGRDETKLRFTNRVRSGQLPPGETWRLDQIDRAPKPVAATLAPPLPASLLVPKLGSDESTVADEPADPPLPGGPWLFDSAAAAPMAATPKAAAADKPTAPPADSTSPPPQPDEGSLAGPPGPRKLAVVQGPNRALAAVERQAAVHVRAGFELGAKRSLFAARTEFLLALDVMVQALDAAGNTTAHATALSAGMRALDEADDFLPQRVGASARSVAEIAAVHRTPILHDPQAAAIPPLVAVQRYYTYAQQQLSAAVEGHEIGSQALYGLGKTYSALARDGQTAIARCDSKAVVWHQAALMANSENFAAANDLAVLLARWGKLAEARDLLQHSVVLGPRAATWQNLAAVHGELGEHELAALAMREADAIRARQPPPPAGPYQIQWVSPDAFGRAAPAPMAQQPRPGVR